MPGSNENNAKILKTIIVFIVVFFLFIIVFNIWMKASLEKSGVSQSLKTTYAKPQVSNVSATAQGQQTTAVQQSGQIDKKTESQSTGQRQLILQ